MLKRDSGDPTCDKWILTRFFMQIFQKNYIMSKHIFRLKDKKMIFCLIKNIKIDKVNLETKNNEDLINQFPCA